MKKVIVVSKTHLDLGYTDYASNVLSTYINKFIPNSIDIANSVNVDGRKFVWTVGSWILKEALKGGTKEQRNALFEACKRGDIAAHGLPFTTHTELLDEDLAEYGMSIIKDLDKMFGRNTIAAKMTDVPGHTIGLVPILAKYGIKLLHIGVNAASAVPNVPRCFLWKNGDSEVVVIYEGKYGGEYESELIEDILYFDHSYDNHGPRGAEGVLSNYNAIKSKYKDYEVVAGTLDDYAELIWQVKDKLPVLTSEIGDSWIHGVGSDPYKVAVYRELLALKNTWLIDGSMQKDSQEYKGFADALICLVEHTWGANCNKYLRDFTNYLRKDFDDARAKDRVIRRNGIYKLPFLKGKISKGEKGRYTFMQKSWDEQRNYLTKAIENLSAEHRAIAENIIKKVTPKQYNAPLDKTYTPNEKVSIGQWTLEVNSRGGIGFLSNMGNIVVANNQNAALQYHSFGSEDFDFWLKNYTRDILQTGVWSVPDFAMPYLSKVEKKFKKGRFNYTVKSMTFKTLNDSAQICVDLTIDDYCYTNLGASKDAQIVYNLTDKNLNIEVIYCGKPANRLAEAGYFRIYPNVDSKGIGYQKISSIISPYDIVENGNRNISAVANVRLNIEGEEYTLNNNHSPLVSLGNGKILLFDNKYEDVRSDGLAFILYDNIWGTNFPLWVEGNMRYEYSIEKSCDK